MEFTHTGIITHTYSDNTEAKCTEPLKETKSYWTTGDKRFSKRTGNSLGVKGCGNIRSSN